MHFQKFKLPVMKKILILFIAATAICTSSFATTYFWVGGVAGINTMADRVNWSTVGVGGASVGTSGTNLTFTSADILIIDGSDIDVAGGLQTGAITATAPSGATTALAQIKLQNGASYTITAATTRTFTLAGSTGTDFDVPTGCTFGTTGGAASNTIAISVLTGATGSIVGTYNLGTGSFGHQLLGADASSIIFASGSTCNARHGSGTPFGTTSLNSVVFQSGSLYIHNTASGNPFGATAPNSVVVFNSGSTYRQDVSVAPAASGRTYANFIWNNAGTGTLAGGSAFTVQNTLTANAGTVNVNTTTTSIGNVVANGGAVNLTQASGTATISGNVTSNNVASSAVFISPGAGTTLTFNGTAAQTITRSGVGTLTFSANAAVVISNTTAAVTFSTSQTVSGLITVNTGAILATSATLTANNAVAVNGTFRINPSGFAQGTGVWTYGASSTLNFANSVSFGFVDTHVFWPVLNGPPNVNISGTGGVNIGNGVSNASRTVPGTFQTSSGVTLSGGSVLTLNGTNQINTSGFFNNSPVYGGSATLVYNTGATFGRGNELTTGTGIPANITVNSGSSLDYGNGATGTARILTGNLVANGGFFMDFGASDMTQPLTVNGNVSIGTTGSLSLSDASGGDIKVGGNWTRTGSGVFTPKSRAVFFINSGTSTVTTASAASFDVLIVDKTSGGLLALANNTTANNALTLTNGVVTTGSNTLTATSTINRTNGWVNGNLQRAVSPSTVSFPVGDATNYAPVSLVIASGTGNFTASTTAPGVPPAAGNTPTGSGISQTKYINRSWTLTTTIGSPSYSAQFIYVNPADIVGGANTNALIIGKNTGGTWSNPGVATSVSPSVTSVTGLTSVGTFFLGEFNCVPPSSLNYTLNTVSYCANAAITTNSPAFTGDAATSYSVSPALPTGLTLNTTTGDITGTPTVAAPAADYTVTVNNACGNTTRDVNITVTANTFTGTGDWTDIARWSCGSVPLTGHLIAIGAGANATLNTNFTIAGSLLMNATSTLTVNTANTLTVSGSADFNGQSVTFKSDNTGTSSLGQVTGSLTGATNVTVERYIPNIGFRSWRLLSVPTTGTQTINAAWQEGNAPLANGTPNFGTQITGTGSLAAAQAAGFDNTAASAALLRYNGTAWAGVPGTGGAISAEKAYFLYIRGERTKGVTGLTTNSSATTMRTNGTLFTGDQLTTIPTTNSFAVVGNVYPSAIDFTTLTRTGGVTNAFYIYDSRIKIGNNVGAYQTFSGTNYFTSVTGGSYGTANVSTNTTIESGQAFFVRTDATPGGGTITIHENSKISGTNGSLGFRPASPAALVKMDSRLYLVSGTGREVADGNAVVFDNAYSTAIDADDALKMTNAAENFAVQTTGKSLAIEGRQPITAEDTLFYKMWNMRQQSYQLELIPANLANSGLIAVLEDSYLNSRTPLDLGVTSTVNFTVDANAASSATDRFRIVFKPSAPLPVSFISISANRTAAGVKADWKVTAERNIRSYEVERSADGRNFITAGTVTATGNSATELSYSFTDAAAPATTLFYRIKSIGTAGEVKYTNVVKVLSGNVKPGFAISPNPVEGGIVNLQFTNQAEGRYTVRLLGTNGQSVFTRVATHAGGNSTQVLNLPSTIASGTYQVEIIAPDKTRTTQTLLVENK